MTTNVNHGSWVRYVPTEPPEGFFGIPSVMYCRRESDGIDWYVFAQKEQHFVDGSIKMAVLKAGSVVSAVYRDASMLFPQECLVVEVIGDDTDDPQAKYGGKIYDPETNTFSDPPPPPVATLDALEARVAELEAKLGGMK